jgi:hypothetical protein
MRKIKGQGSKGSIKTRIPFETRARLNQVNLKHSTATDQDLSEHSSWRTAHQWDSQINWSLQKHSSNAYTQNTVAEIITSNKIYIYVMKTKQNLEIIISKNHRSRNHSLKILAIYNRNLKSHFLLWVVVFVALSRS